LVLETSTGSINHLMVLQFRQSTCVHFLAFTVSGFGRQFSARDREIYVALPPADGFVSGLANQGVAPEYQRAMARSEA